jgi:hypothetical protein
VTKHKENAIAHKDIASGALFDIEGDFDRTLWLQKGMELCLQFADGSVPCWKAEK